MTAAYRMRGLGWFAGVVIVAIGLYLVSLQVATERKKVENVDRAIAAANRDLRMLDTEFNTRANLAQLERWNGDVLALSAPRAEQFIGDARQLAQIDFNAPAGHDGTVHLAAYVVPALHALPGLDLQLTGSGSAGESGGAASPMSPQTAPATTAPAAIAPAAIAIAVPSATAAATVTKARPAGMAPPSITHAASIALLDRKLLSDSTMSDLVTRAHDEASLR